MTFHELPTTFEDIGLALLTILIPLAIAILTDLFQKKGSKSSDFVELDLLVILKSIFDVKWILVYAVLIFLPFVFWGGSILWNRVAVSVSLGGMVGIAMTICVVYLWVRGDVLKSRLSYLKRMADREDMKRAWRSVWMAEQIDYNYEIEFVKTFSSCVEKLIVAGPEGSETMAILLNDFTKRVAARYGPSLVSVGGFVSSLLNWNFEAWKKRKALRDNESKKGEWLTLHYLYRSTTSALVEIEKHCLKMQYGEPLIKCIEEHVKVLRKDGRPDELTYYPQDLLGGFYKGLFSVLPDLGDEKDDLESYFPKEWKITSSNWLDSKNMACEISLDNFREWATRRITGAKNDSDDPELDYVLNLLFPEVDPIIWADILILVLAPPWENQVSSALHCHKTFGRLPNKNLLMVVGPGESFGGFPRSVRDGTYELALTIFSSDFTLENIEIFEGNADTLQFEKNSEQEGRLKILQYVFKNLRERLEKRSEQNHGAA